MTSQSKPPDAQGPQTETAKAAREVEVLIVGGGFSGVGAAIKLTQEGFTDIALLEKAERLGGTWRENTYPGCACDVMSTLYSYSFAGEHEWQRAFGRQPEILDYLEKVAQRHEIHAKVHFNTEFLGATWDERRARWQVQTNAGEFSARLLVAAAGPLHKPVTPDLPGLADFKGTIFHSSEWDHGHDLDGRSVAVVGTGASAIQFVPEIQPRVRRLHLFQRTAPWVLPKPDHEIGALERAIFRHVPFAQRALRGLLYGIGELVQLAQRRPSAMRRLQRVGVSHLRRQVPDRGLREQLTPEFALGCKRILLSNVYYPALCQPNCEVIPAAVREVREHSVVGADGVEREVDTIIFGTGFQVTDIPIAALLRGREGRTLREVWQGSPQAYLGTTVAGFPNLFMLIGPNLGNGHGSAMTIIEAQVGYLLQALRTMRRSGVASVEVRGDVQERYNGRVQRALEGTVWNAGGCSSYYLDVNGRNSTIYPWTTIDMRRRMRRFDADSYIAGRA
jgi:cation diffusion facilitator CzcD-associated flavoprotein CzcO